MTLTGDAGALVTAQDPSWRHGLKRNSPMEVPVHARPVLVAAVLGLFLATSAGAAVDAGSSVGFRFLPKKAFQGQPASLSVIARPSGVRCVPTIRYANGALQALKPTVARGNRASWAFTIPAKARIGSASATVKCGRAGRITRSFAVVGPPAAPAKIVVKKSGFSQRVRSISARGQLWRRALERLP
jgi:hypothetical protein